MLSKMAMGSIESSQAQKSLHLKTIHIKLGMNGKRKCLKRFKGVGKNPKAEMIAPRRELCFSRGFSAEIDWGLNLVLWSAEPLQFSEMVTSSVIVPALLFFFYKPICESAIKSSYPKLSVSGNMIHSRSEEINIFFSYFAASWPKFSAEMVKISAHFPGLGLLINIQQSNFTQQHILTA